jgi:hypothetical protein
MMHIMACAANPVVLALVRVYCVYYQYVKAWTFSYAHDCLAFQQTKFNFPLFTFLD